MDDGSVGLSYGDLTSSRVVKKKMKKKRKKKNKRVNSTAHEHSP
jgi:hypothetical protein